MSHEHFICLTEWVENLERENRRLRRFVKISTVGAVLVLLAGAHHAEDARVVEAERFLLHDAEGKIRASLQIMPGGGPALSLYDGQSLRRAFIGLEPDGSPGIGLTSDGSTGIGLKIKPDGARLLGIIGPNGKDRATLGLSPEGNAVLRLAGDDGRGGLGLIAKGDGLGGVTIADRDQNDRLMLWCAKDGLPNIVLKDPNGDDRIRMAVEEDDSAALALFDRGGAGSIGLLATPSGTLGLTLFDRQGKDRLGLGLTKENSLGLGLRDRDGVDRLGVGLRAAGTPAITACDASGKILFRARRRLLPRSEHLRNDGSPRLLAVPPKSIAAAALRPRGLRSLAYL
jgi:hypothetical protein